MCNSAIFSRTLYPVWIYLGDVVLSHVGSHCPISVSPDLTCSPMEDGLKTEACNCSFSLETGLYKKDRKLRTRHVCRSPISIDMQVQKYISKSSINGVWIIHPFGLYTPLLPLLQVIKSFLILKSIPLHAEPLFYQTFTRTLISKADWLSFHLLPLLSLWRRYSKAVTSCKALRKRGRREAGDLGNEDSISVIDHESFQLNISKGQKVWP